VAELARALRGPNPAEVRTAVASARAAGVGEQVIAALRDLARPVTVPQPVATPLRRLARGLQIPLFEESARGIRPLTSPAERSLGVGFPGTAADAIERLTGHPATDPTLLGCLERARKAGEAACDLNRGANRWRLYASMGDQGLQLAVVALADSAAGELEVLATVNHEMANGLTAMASLAAIARDPESTPAEVSDAIRHIEEAANDTLRAVQSTRRALKRSQLSEAPVVADVGPLLADLVDGFAAVASRRKIHVRRSIEGQLIAAAPPEDLRSIVWNLMKNAIEAVPKGGTVDIQAEAIDHRLRIVVRDDGPGMDPETRDRVFDPYFTTKREGSGLGLPLVRHLALRLGGELTVESAKGHGTRFEVLLPRVHLVPTADEAISGMRPTAAASRAVVVGPAAEGLTGALREHRVQVTTLDALRDPGAPLDFAFVDPAAVHLAAALRESVHRIVWVGRAPVGSVAEDAVLPAPLDGDDLRRWLLTHVSRRPRLDAVAGQE